MNQPEPQNWARGDLIDPHRLPDKARRVLSMFDRIAPRYDLLNHLLSFGLDIYWRRLGVSLAMVRPDQRVLDLCCGTGDMALAFAAAQRDLAEIVAIDFSEEMLKIARNKYRKFILKQGRCGRRHRVQSQCQSCKPVQIKWLRGDAQRVDFPDASFDRISCVFGLRNLQDPAVGLREMHRLLKPTGRAVILEFALPKNPALKWLYNCYFRVLLPLIGGMISGAGSRAYQYLPASVTSFAPAEKLAAMAGDAGFDAVHIKMLSFGTVLALVAEKKLEGV